MSIMQMLMMGAPATVPALISGKLFSWGYNANSDLGDGSAVEKSSPVQIGALTDWTNKIAVGANTTYIIKTDDTLWCWGYNANGQLGLGDTTVRSSPVQIGALTDWAQVHCNQGLSNTHVLAVKTDGTLWGWGYNNVGQLGLGDTAARSSPVQVGALTDWAAVWCGYDWTMAIKTDGTLWGWGDNTQGNLGDGSTTAKSSPVQVGAETDWLGIVGCVLTGNRAHAIRSA